MKAKLESNPAQLRSKAEKNKKDFIERLIHHLGEYAIETIGATSVGGVSDSAGSSATEIVPTNM